MAKTVVATDIAYAAVSCGPPVAYAMVVALADIGGLAALSGPFGGDAVPV
jgi:hypothetical protein